MSDASPVPDQPALKVGFIGIGTMGRPMAERLVAANHPVTVFDQAPSAMAPLVALGAKSARSAAEASDGADVVLLSLPTPQIVEAAVAGTEGVLEAPDVPPLIVDLSTNSSETVAQLGKVCAAAGTVFVDAPVSGGAAGASEGSISIMVGADATTFVQLEGLLGCLGSKVVHVGPPGSGTIAKIVNNQLFLAAGVLVQEAYVLGQALGMAPTDLHKVIAASSGGPYAKLAPLLLGRRFDDVIFRLDIAAKDLGLAAGSADAAGVDVPLTRAALDVYEDALTAGDGELVFHATLKELERRAGVTLEPLRRPPRQER